MKNIKKEREGGGVILPSNTKSSICLMLDFDVSEQPDNHRDYQNHNQELKEIPCEQIHDRCQIYLGKYGQITEYIPHLLSPLKKVLYYYIYPIFQKTRGFIYTPSHPTGVNNIHG